MNENRSSSFNRGVIIMMSLLFVATLAAMVVSPYMLGGEDMAFWEFVVSASLIAIPVGLLYVMLGILIVAVYRHGRGEAFNARLARFLYWSPRISCILLVAFMSLFAFDVFEEGLGLGEMLLGFLMHMLPMIALAIVLAFAWRWPWVGTALFGLAALVFSARLFVAGWQGLGTVMLFGVPMLLIALLFAANAGWKKEIDSARHPAMQAS